MGMDSNFQYGWQIAVEDLSEKEYADYLAAGGYLPGWLRVPYEYQFPDGAQLP